MSQQTKQVTCPCGNHLTMFRDDDGWWDVCDVECEACGRRSDGGNGGSGEIFGWLTRRQINESQSEFDRQSFSAECNEWMGRGNHPF